ncbi:hypothetical protein [Larkinella soli]|uniref:hypothetical protein n=1 Tax=Larkinella soli TaxID=1770527 RepID=UPI000FFC5AC8|nr:hypothetical protein [Larkinella soli]
MTYDELGIHEKINLKQVLNTWAYYATDHFRDELDKKVYRVRATRSGSRRKQNKTATGALRRAWYHQVGSERVVMQFLLYGRFVDMGVGKGTSHNDRGASRLLREGSPAGPTPRRKRKPWYSKRKGYEVKRLREILAERHVTVPLQALESMLEFPITLTV